ncbi:MAG: DUF3180 domain-containing protein [Nocardioides sp.]
MSGAALSGFAIVGLVGGWVLRRIAEALAGHAPSVSWPQVIAPYLAALILGLVSWATWQRVQRGRAAPLDAQRAVNRLVLARSSALIGSLIAGGYAGYAVSWVGLISESATPTIVRSGIAALGGVSMMLMGLVLQRACRIRATDDSDLR